MDQKQQPDWERQNSILKAYKVHKASGNFEHNCIDGYRYVLVPGGVRIGANINVNDFNKVKAAFNIAD